MPVRPYSPRLAVSLCLAGLLLGVSCAPMQAQQWAKDRLAASPRHGEYVTIHESSGRNLQAWVVYPEVKGKAPVVLMIHEIFGLTDWAREMADELAAEGFVVIEPDLLSGLGPGQNGAAFVPVTPGGTAAFPDQGAVVKAVSGLPSAQVLFDLNNAADYAEHLPAASGKLFVAGFCWGGGQSFLFATQRHDLSAAFVFYGPPPPPDRMPFITAPVYGFYGEMDARITSTVPATQAAMKADGKTYDPVIFKGAGHGFMRAGDAPPGADPAGMAGQTLALEIAAADRTARKEAFTRLVHLLKTK